jgi:CheY-like chemotaxis protein
VNNNSFDTLDINTAKKLRAMGYGGKIVALTANALAGNDEMFAQNGFDDFLSKPIDTARLDAILRKWIPEEKRDQESVNSDFDSDYKMASGSYPDNSNHYPHSPVSSPQSLINIPGVDVEHGIAMTGGTLAACKRILALFCKDVEKRLELLQEAPDENNLSIFST